MKGKQRRVDISKDTLDVLFAGDFCPAGGNIYNACIEGKQSRIFTNIKDHLIDADIVMVNLECPVTESKSKICKIGPNIKAHPVTAVLLRECNVKIVNISNNHIMDYGVTGFRDTINLLNSIGIKHVGAGTNIDEARKPIYVTENEITIAFASCAETEFNIANGESAGCAPMDAYFLTNTIPEAKSFSDFVVVSAHCGSEHYPLPSPRIKSFCRSAVDQGASLVICHHTHTFGGFETYKSGQIYYGLGNFLFNYTGKNPPQRWGEGLLIGVSFRKGSPPTCKVIPYKFNNTTNFFEGATSASVRAITASVDMLSYIIANDERLLRVWKAYSLRQYNDWYRPVLAKNAWRCFGNTKARSMLEWHYFANQSHSDIITTALNSIRVGDFPDVKQIDEQLSKIFHRRTMLDRFIAISRYLR
ncbi:MAG: poly-gamma-glutamate synthesis protein [Desulfovibrionaceae bacterium]|nr:MAG: poly-gamma-glutamate synthesis protein [Desulfovibrionaceae bacterium]